MLSEKGKRINFNDGFKFSLTKCLKNDIKRLRCVKRTCTFYYKIENDNIIEKKTFSFNHDYDKTNITTR